MIRGEKRFQKHSARVSPSWHLLFLYMQKFALLFISICVLPSQNTVSMHSSLHVQEEQINMPEQNLQNLNYKSHLASAQKLLNTIIPLITFSILILESVLLYAKIQCTENPKTSKSRSRGVKRWHLWHALGGHGVLIVSLFLAYLLSRFSEVIIFLFHLYQLRILNPNLSRV